MSIEHAERAERQAVNWTARVDSQLAIARNFSATGLYLEIADPSAVGSSVEVVMAVESEGKRFRMVCVGEVVRAELQDGRRGIGVRLTQPAKLLPASSAEEGFAQDEPWRRVGDSRAGNR